jgi:hypothetical protein
MSWFVNTLARLPKTARTAEAALTTLSITKEKQKKLSNGDLSC